MGPIMRMCLVNGRRIRTQKNWRWLWSIPTLFSQCIANSFSSPGHGFGRVWAFEMQRLKLIVYRTTPSFCGFIPMVSIWSCLSRMEILDDDEIVTRDVGFRSPGNSFSSCDGLCAPINYMELLFYRFQDWCLVALKEPGCYAPGL